MGNCCTKKDQGAPPRQSALPPTPNFKNNPSQQNFNHILTLQGPELNLQEEIQYQPNAPLSYIQDYLQETHKNLPEITIHRGLVEYTNQTVTIRQLGIQPNDTLIIKLKLQDQEVSINEEYNIRHIPMQNTSKQSLTPTLKDSFSNIQYSEQSLHDIAEEESTTQNQIGRINPKIAISDRQNNYKRRQSGGTQQLWRTARNVPASRQYIRYDALDISETTNNTQDYSIRERHFPGNNLQFNIRASNGQSVLVESDESMLDESKIAESQVQVGMQHPSDFFKDLQGPFSVIKKI